MQITNTGLYQSLSQYGGPSSDQTAVRTPARPVIIEGQVVNDRDTREKPENSTAQRAELDSEKERFELPDGPQNNQQAVLSADSQSSETSFQPSAQLQGSDYSVINQNSGAGIQNAYSDNSTSFPFSNRRSFNGLSGSALIVQSYLSNSPSASIQQAYSPAGVDYYI